MTPEGKRNLSRSLRQKWKSGTRKPNPKSSHEKQRATILRLISEGKFRTRVFSEDDRKKAAIARESRPEEMKRAERAKAAAKKIGVPNPPGPSAKGPDHWKSKYWVFKAPNQTIIKGWNLNEIVRQHSDLFHPSDLIWKGPDCKASKGLRRLFEMKKDGSMPRTLSWKGWTIGDRRDEESNAKVTGAPHNETNKER